MTQQHAVPRVQDYSEFTPVPGMALVSRYNITDSFEHGAKNIFTKGRLYTVVSIGPSRFFLVDDLGAMQEVRRTGSPGYEDFVTARVAAAQAADEARQLLAECRGERKRDQDYSARGKVNPGTGDLALMQAKRHIASSRRFLAAAA